MGFEAKPWLLWWAVAASAAVHVSAAAGFGAFAHALPRGDADTLSEVEIVVLDSAPLEEPEDPAQAEPREAPRIEPLPAEPPPAGDEVEDRQRLASLAPSYVTPRAVELPEVAEPSDEPEEDPAPTDQESSAPAVLLALDPASVAAAAVFAAAPPSDHAPRGPSGPTDQETEEALERALSGSLAAAANARPHVSRRGPPRLRQRRDGSYDFTGHAFSARIAPDGTVSFDDRPGVDLDSPSFSRPNGLVPSGSFDIADAVSRARGHDPYRHERTWFMRETEELRDRLADAADATNQRRGMARMNGDLRRLWAGRGTAQRRRQRIFAMWDDCTEDEIGRHARAAILNFVRRSLAAGTADAYPASELGELNRQRMSREPFTPY
ncbi:MAG: hypothetical protein DRJ42_02410 [Deltaproteobacteria bacterium]|nr:MAG: hypothetical protein DRJ42_02410 [Deltaproteobacteria bacterium]